MVLEILAASTEVVDTPASSGNPLTDIADIFVKFGWKKYLFIAQCVNFLIVAFVLKKFAFGPLGEMLAKRRERIKEGEEKLAKIEKDLAESEKRTAEAIEAANAKAKEMIAEAQESGARITEEKTQEAIASSQKILAKAEEAATAEREIMVKELKSDFGRLVAAATATVSGKVLSDADHSAINEEALSAIEN